MKKSFWNATLVLLFTQIVTPVAQAQNFKCYEKAGKFSRDSSVAVVVNLSEHELAVTSLKGEVDSVVYDMSSASVVTTRSGEWLNMGDFSIENSGVDRHAYYHYSAKHPTVFLDLKCFLVKK